MSNKFETDDDGLITGEVLTPIIWGPGKARAVQAFAAENGVDLSKSYFYADGDEDVALMYLVGNPRPTNPAGKLAAVAAKRGWPVLQIHQPQWQQPGIATAHGAGVASMVPIAAGAVGLGLLTRNKRTGVNFFTSTFGRTLLTATGMNLNVLGQGEPDRAATRGVHLQPPQPGRPGHRRQAGRATTSPPSARRNSRTTRSSARSGKMMDAAFIDRDDPKAAVESLKKVEELARKGLSILIAPEGTRLDTTEVGPFKKGPFRIAMSAGIPIVPIVIRNAEVIAARDSSTFNPGTVDVAVFPPIPVDDWTAENLTERDRRGAPALPRHAEGLAARRTARRAAVRAVPEGTRQEGPGQEGAAKKAHRPRRPPPRRRRPRRPPAKKTPAKKAAAKKAAAKEPPQAPAKTVPRRGGREGLRRSTATASPPPTTRWCWRRCRRPPNASCSNDWLETPAARASRLQRRRARTSPDDDPPPAVLARLVEELEADEDRSVVPVRVFWVPGGLPTRSKVVALLSGRDTYRPPEMLQRRILARTRRAPRVVAGEPAKVSELRQQWSDTTVAENPREFARFVIRRAILAIERVELRLLGPGVQVAAAGQARDAGVGAFSRGPGEDPRRDTWKRPARCSTNSRPGGAGSPST